MDGRWVPFSRDSLRRAQVILHPTAAIYEVRRGLDAGSDDSINLTPFVKDMSHSAFEARVTFAFNRELFGPWQPKPLQVLELQLWQNEEWKPIWLGHIDALNSFTMSRGERGMQLIAKTRDQQDIWRNTPRVTPMYPKLTDLTYMVRQMARNAEMKSDEIVLPPSSITTAHGNTQLSDMSTWDMTTAIFVALGWSPFIDGQGRLRAADRSLQARRPDVILDDTRMVKVGGSRQRPPVNRVRVKWLSPELKIWKQQAKILATKDVTIGWWLPYWQVDIPFSQDETQRASNTRLNPNPGINRFVDVCKETWTQTSPTKGTLKFINGNFYAVLAAMGVSAYMSSTRNDSVVGTVFVPPGSLLVVSVGAGSATGTINVGPPLGALSTVPTGWGSLKEIAIQVTLFALMMNIGTGHYEIIGNPYDWIHARNVSEAFDSSVPTWVNNVRDIECDFVTNEAHARAIAIRELIYEARSANKWSVSIVDDPRIEYGDILQFPDGSQLYVEDYTRRLERGGEAVLDVKGFLVGPVRASAGSLISTVLPIGGLTPPGIPPTGSGGGTPVEPGDGSPGSSSTNPIVTMSSNPAQIVLDVTASWNHYYPIGKAKGIDIGGLGQWIDYASNPDTFSNGKWYLGWNLYWETRMDTDLPGYHSGASNPEYGSQPAKYRA